MSDHQPATPDEPSFARGNERLDELLADPQLAADVAAAHADAEEMDRVYAMNLAMIRHAAQMTQVEVARKLGVGQGVISRLEHRDDMLLSTLYDYLMATGADGAGIVAPSTASASNSTWPDSAVTPSSKPPDSRSPPMRNSMLSQDVRRSSHSNARLTRLDWQSVMAVFSRRIIGLVSNAQCPVHAGHAAVAREWQDRPASDYGTQYMAWAFGRRIQDAGMLGSMRAVGDCYDNAMMKSCCHALQPELLDRS